MNTWLLKLNRRERLLAAVTLVAASIAVLYVFVLEPIALRWSRVGAEASTLTQQLAELELRVREQQGIGEQVKTLERAVAGRAERVESQSLVFNDVEHIIRNANMELRSIRPLETSREGDYRRCRVEVTLRGDTPQLFDLLSRLQVPESFLSVESMSLNVGNSPPPLTLTLVIGQLVEHKEGGGR